MIFLSLKHITYLQSHSKKLKCHYIKRTAVSIFHETTKRFLKKLSFNDALRYSYSTRSVNKPEAVSQDKQALHNNPTVGSQQKRHLEIHRVVCNIPGCSGKLCIGFCGNKEIERKAIAHGTHGKAPVHETDKKTFQISSQDFNGNKKPQKLVFYQNPHDSKPTQEHIQGTNQINTDPQIMAIIDKNETK